jgi:hypothetical protein
VKSGITATYNVANLTQFFRQIVVDIVRQEGLWSADMEPMTPEERWTKFENAMQSLMENQARHDVQIAQNEAAIRDLLVVSRIFLDSQKEMTAQIKANSARNGRVA